MKVLIFLMLSSLCLAASKEDATKVSKAYIESIFNKDLETYKDNVSESYFKAQTLNGFIKDTFQSKKAKKKLGDFDIKVQKGAVDELYFVNIKEKSESTFGDNWFVLKLNSKGKLVVDGIHHFED